MNDIDILKKYYDPNTPEYEAARARLDSGEPVAYIVGEAYFYGERYRLNSDCLIPRPDTECAVEEIIKLARPGMRIADICCGSGCIGISALCHTRETTALGVDISEGALSAADGNARLNGVSERYSTMRADLLSPEFSLGGRFDIVASNPPYIRREVIATLDASVREHEPMIALDGGEDGLDFYRILISRFGELVSEGGSMVLEIGYDQGDSLRVLAEGAGLAFRLRRDYGGRDRVVILS